MANQNSDFMVDEAGLDDGTRAGSVATSAGGVYERPPGGQIDSFVVNGVDLTGGGSLSGDFGTLTVSVDGQGNYRWDYLLTDNTIDHRSQGRGEEDINDPFRVEVNSNSQGTRTENLRIFVKDDVPEATATGPDSVAEGEVASGTWSVNAGADGLREMRVYVSEEVGFYRLDTPIELSVGTLIVNSNGTWEFTAKDGLDQSTNPELEFTLRPIDNDGDRGRAKVTVEITEGDSTTPPTTSDFSVDEAGLADGTSAGSAATSASGVYEAPAGGQIDSFVVNGVDLTGGGSLSGDFGTLTVSVDGQGSYNWTYQLTENSDDHRSQGRGDEGVNDAFKVEVSGASQGTQTDNLRIFVEDDVPDATATAPDSVVEGEVASGTWSINAGADGLREMRVYVSESSGFYRLDTPIELSVGTLTVNSDGTWRFEAKEGLDHSTNPELEFTLRPIDNDGDRGRVKVTVDITEAMDTGPTTPSSDGDPNTVSPSVVVDEDGLPEGNAGGPGDVAGEATVVSAQLGYDFGADGPASSGAFTWTTDGLPTNLQSQGNTVVYEVSADGLSLTGRDEVTGEAVFTVVRADDSDLVTVSLLRPLDHFATGTEDDIDLALGYVVKDAEGSEAKGYLEVTVDDDTPLVVDDNSSTEVGQAVTKDVLANDSPGADLGHLVEAEVVSGDGQVVINDDHTLTFIPDDGFTGSASIKYKVLDCDGDPMVGHWYVDVIDGGGTGPTTPDSDGDPNTTAPNAVVDEDGLPGGIAGGIEDVPGERTVATGSLGYSFGSAGPGSFAWSTAGLPALTSGGSPVNWSPSSNGLSLTGSDSSGNSVISVQLTDIASGSYRVVLTRPLDHSDPNVESDIDFSVGYTITDSAGDSATGSIDITIDDDMPVTNADSATTDNDGSVTVDVLGNDDFGADGSGGITNATVQGGAGVGTVTVNQDGTLTFTPNPGFVGNATINYTATDGDGSAVGGSLDVAVGDGGTGPSTPETDGSDPVVAVVDEDGLPGGIAGGSGDAAGEAVVVTGLLGYSFGDDGPAAGGGFAWGADSSGLPAQTSDGQDIRYFLSSNALSLVGLDQAGNRVIAIDMLDASTGQYRVVLSQPLDHPVADIEDDLRFNVSYTVTDSDGDTAQGNLVVVVDDDSPQPSAVQAGVLTDGATDDISFFGADGAGSLTFGASLAGTQVTSPSGLPVRTSGGETLTYQLSGDGLTLQATTAGGFVAFEVSLAADGSSYTVDVFDDGIAAIGQSSLELSEATKEVVVPFQTGTGATGFGHRYLAFDNGDVAPDVLVSAWSVDDGMSRPTFLRTQGDNFVAVGGDTLTGQNEITRIDFIDDLAFSSNSPNWEDHRGVNFFSDVVFRAERMEFPMLTIKAIGLAPDGNATSGHPYEVGQENVLTLSSGDIRFFDTSGRDVTSSLDITELDDGSLRIMNIPSGSRFELATDQPFEALEFKGLHDWYAFGLSGDFEYSWLEKGDGSGSNNGQLTLPVEGADGDGDTVSGSLELTLPSAGSASAATASARSLDTSANDDGDGEIWAAVGADTIVLDLGDVGTASSPSSVVVNNFTLGDTATNADADTLDLSDILDDATDEDVSAYLYASQEGSDTVLSVKTDGGIGASGDGADQVITLTEVSMGGASSDSFLDKMVQHGQLDVE